MDNSPNLSFEDIFDLARYLNDFDLKTTNSYASNVYDGPKRLRKESLKFCREKQKINI